VGAPRRDLTTRLRPEKSRVVAERQGFDSPHLHTRSSLESRLAPAWPGESFEQEAEWLLVEVSCLTFAFPYVIVGRTGPTS